jgi:hypothetical protein
VLDPTKFLLRSFKTSWRSQPQVIPSKSGLVLCLSGFEESVLALGWLIESELRSLVFRSRSHRFSSFCRVDRLLMIGLGKF